jgi:hypothetical protein
MPQYEATNFKLRRYQVVRENLRTSYLPGEVEMYVREEEE